MSDFIELLDDEAMAAALQAHAVTTAAARWSAVHERLRSGEDVVAAEAGRFPWSAARSLLAARWWFSSGAFHRLAVLPPSGVETQLAPWLQVAVQLAAADVCDEKSQGEAFDLITALVHAPYVVIIESGAPWYVQPFPDPRVFYGGLYESTGAGASSGPSIIRLCKSTGEPVRPAERRTIVAGMRVAFREDAADDGEDNEWTFTPLADDDPRVVSALVEPVW